MLSQLVSNLPVSKAAYDGGSLVFVECCRVVAVCAEYVWKIKGASSSQGDGKGEGDFKFGSCFAFV
jgi:hypothetical protein